MEVSFKLDFPITACPVFKHDSSLFLIGSCFSESMSVKLLESGMQVCSNPYGILYNPVSISNALTEILDKKQYSSADLMQNHEGRFVSLSHHGRYSGFQADEVLEQINRSITGAHDFLKKAEGLIITLGSARVFKHKDQNRVVANCHKIPSTFFEKEMLGVEAVFASLIQTLQRVKRINPDIKIILTVSPVKHIREGLVENQRSKSVLSLAVAALESEKDPEVHYFPAFEIVNDELRDYRFYKTDMVHPGELAIEYIWKRFAETYFDAKALEKIDAARKLNASINHRPLHVETHNNYLIDKINQFISKYPINE